MSAGRHENEYLLATEEEVEEGIGFQYDEDVFLRAVQTVFPSPKYPESKRVYIACVLGMNRSREAVEERLRYLEENKDTFHKKHQLKDSATKETVAAEIRFIATNIRGKKLDQTLDDWKAKFVKKYPNVLTKEEARIFEAEGALLEDDDEEEAEEGIKKKGKKKRDSDTGYSGSGSRKRKSGGEGEDKPSFMDEVEPEGRRKITRKLAAEEGIKEEKVEFDVNSGRKMTHAELQRSWKVAFVEQYFVDAKYRQEIIHVLQNTNPLFPTYKSKTHGAGREFGPQDRQLVELLIDPENTSFEQITRKFVPGLADAAVDSKELKEHIESVKKTCTIIVKCAGWDYTHEPELASPTQPKPSKSKSKPKPKASPAASSSSSSSSFSSPSSAPIVPTVNMTPSPASGSGSSSSSNPPVVLPEVCNLPAPPVPVESLSAEEIETVSQVTTAGPSTFKPSLYRSRLVFILSEFDVSTAKRGEGFSLEDDETIVRIIINRSVASFPAMLGMMQNGCNLQQLKVRSHRLIRSAIEAIQKSIGIPPPLPTSVHSPLANHGSPPPPPPPPDVVSVKQEPVAAQPEPSASSMPPAAAAAAVAPLKQSPSSTRIFSPAGDTNAASKKVTAMVNALQKLHVENQDRALFLEQALFYVMDCLKRWNVTVFDDMRFLFIMIDGRLEEQEDVSEELQTRIAELKKQCWQKFQQ